MSAIFQDALSSYFRDAKVVVTGHTGFKGGWLAFWLAKSGAEVFGISDKKKDGPNFFDAVGLEGLCRTYFLDLTDLKSTEALIRELEPDFIFHLAAQPLVRESYVHPVETWKTNVMGTVNVLEGLRKLVDPCISIFITSDKCYKNLEWPWGYRETDALGGDDPYGGSKGAAEFAINSFHHSYFKIEDTVRVCSVRAGNVIGGGDWSVDRIVPDCISSWSKSNPAILRSPDSTRPWQHVLEPLGGYMKLAHSLKLSPSLAGESFNFGPNSDQEISVKNLVYEMAKHWPSCIVKIDENYQSTKHENNLLKLNCDKASNKLSWAPTWDFEETVRATVEWYRKFYSSQAMDRVTIEQISTFLDGKQW